MHLANCNSDNNVQPVSEKRHEMVVKMEFEILDGHDRSETGMLSEAMGFRDKERQVKIQTKKAKWVQEKLT